MERGNRKSRIGTVISNKMTKTVVVRVERRVADTKYGRIVKQAKNFKAHDEDNACKPGDRVRIVETRPMSKDKRWRVVETITKATEV